MASSDSCDIDGYVFRIQHHIYDVNYSFVTNARSWRSSLTQIYVAEVFDPSDSIIYTDNCLRAHSLAVVPNEYVDDIAREKFYGYILPHPDNEHSDWDDNNLKPLQGRNVRSGQHGVWNIWNRRLVCMALGLCVAVVMVVLFNVLNSSKSARVCPLPATRHTVANFSARRPMMNFDYENNMIILSQLSHMGYQLDVERLRLNDTRFDFESVPVPLHMKGCRQVHNEVMCCRRRFSTRCFIKEGNTTRHIDEHWMLSNGLSQALQVDGTMLVLRNHADYRILDTSRQLVYAINFDEKPKGLTPASFFFPMVSRSELTELALLDDREFFMCEYVLLNTHRYQLVGSNDGKCTHTRFTRHPAMRGIRFCSNPIYHAVVQFDTMLARNYNQMRWSLQMFYEDDSSMFQYEAVDVAPLYELVVECNPETINVYIASEQRLLKYEFDLPRSGIQSLMGNFF